VATEAVEGAVERIIDTFQLWSNLPKIDGTSVAIDFPLLTQLIQQDWDRVMGGEDGQLPGKGFLIAYHSSAAAVGHLPAGELAEGSSRGRVVSAQGRVAGWPIHRPALGGGADASWPSGPFVPLTLQNPEARLVVRRRHGHEFWTPAGRWWRAGRAVQNTLDPATGDIVRIRSRRASWVLWGGVAVVGAHGAAQVLGAADASEHSITGQPYALGVRPW
jgi:hypothetical protein